MDRVGGRWEPFIINTDVNGIERIDDPGSFEFHELIDILYVQLLITVILSPQLLLRPRTIDIADVIGLAVDVELVVRVGLRASDVVDVDLIPDELGRG